MTPPSLGLGLYIKFNALMEFRVVCSTVMVIYTILFCYFSDESEGLCHQLTAVCERRPELVPFKKLEVKRDEICLEHKLGAGKFGEVWKGESQINVKRLI